MLLKAMSNSYVVGGGVFGMSTATRITAATDEVVSSAKGTVVELITSKAAVDVHEKVVENMPLVMDLGTIKDLVSIAGIVLSSMFLVFKFLMEIQLYTLKRKEQQDKLKNDNRDDEIKRLQEIVSTYKNGKNKNR